MAPDFLKKNPQHTVPTLEYNGTFICESHAIISFLVDKFAKDDSLYPKDPLKRALCDQRMYFDSGILFPVMRAITFQLFFEINGNIPKAKYDAVKSGFEFLETFLEGNLYVCGNTMTIADFCCAASAHSNTAFVPVIKNTFPNIYAWMERMKKVPHYHEAVGKGAELHIKMIHSQTSKLGSQ
ncbi:GstE2.2 family protein [Megaselia abdita]